MAFKSNLHYAIQLANQVRELVADKLRTGLRPGSSYLDMSR